MLPLKTRAEVLAAGRPAPPPGEGDANTSPRRASWRAGLSAHTRELLDRDEAVFLRQSLSTPCLDVLAGCAGSTLTTLDGRELLDFHGNSLHQTGHAHPGVVAAIKAQLDTMAFCPRRFTNEPAIALAEALADIAPGRCARTLFAPSGALAVGMALKLARLATGRFKTVSLWDAFHGASLDACSVGGEALFRSGIGPLLPGTEHVPPPEPYRCVLNTRGCRDCDLACARYLEYVLEKEGDVGAVIAEPLRATTVNIPPPGYWPAVRAACDKHGALLVFDETATCLGRTGRLFACSHFGADPDIVVLGKGLGGGIMPLAAMVADPALDVGGDVALGHYTHEKNPTACAAGLAVLDILARDGLVPRAARLGREALTRLSALAADHPGIGQVRGLGLALAVELVRDRTSREPDNEAADAVMYRCLRRGLAFKTSHGNILTLTPPLTITETDLDRALGILSDALAGI
ncbi:Adenosylmethionine-8-amino-7-oxononanoate aminotransferase [Desulfovibrio sp. DV]|uniref:(R)-1-hydroxy-2-aminoethylphosphonate ammonia-lyase n=1 Tax=Desulfovibrio sp. DV TaxID=1844708 RepID=UPI00095CF134|nr:aspartate aminotransferase family protein [Desulfovibrio sp. DV]OLN24728.1 Adenosylmethionine-8-amino-7-oxononanoate aminotransferase [Desulfovibrio sp. DV]